MKLIKFKSHSDLDSDDDDLKYTHIVGVFQCAYIETLCQLPANKGECDFEINPDTDNKITCPKCLSEIKGMEERLKELKKFTKVKRD